MHQCAIKLQLSNKLLVNADGGLFSSSSDGCSVKVVILLATFALFKLIMQDEFTEKIFTLMH